MDGTAIKYRPGTDGTFTLYSEGEDLKDNGGDTTLPPEKKNFRNLWDRKDFVWPAAALPEEVEAIGKNRPQAISWDPPAQRQWIALPKHRNTVPLPDY